MPLSKKRMVERKRKDRQTQVKPTERDDVKPRRTTIILRSSQVVPEVDTSPVKPDETDFTGVIDFPVVKPPLYQQGKKYKPGTEVRD